MFDDASAFNQDLGNWDVSGGTDFVSNDQSVRFYSILGFGVKSIPGVWLFKEKALSTLSCFPLFSHVSRICLKRPLSLIRTSVSGTSPGVPTL
jgi:hypothetical protein